MEKRLKHVSKEKDRLTMSKRNTGSSLLLMKNSELIPTDLIIEIFLRLPVKSIARFLCVSKDWATILRSPYFTDLYVTMSSSRPRLLFSLKTKGKWLFFSAPQPQNLNQNSSPLTADYHMCFPIVTCPPSYINAPVHGLVCTEHISFIHGYNDYCETIIYNPSTGQSIPIPSNTITRRSTVDVIRTYLGYDPINKQYKVLCISVYRDSNKPVGEHQVLALGTKKPAWKIVECSLPHYPLSNDICINGVLFYSAVQCNMDSKSDVVVCFDVRSEKFKYVKAIDNKGMSPSTLINYSGKLCVFREEFICGETTSLELWVLNDAEKNNWSQHIYVLPPSWKTLVVNTELLIVGITCNGDIVFAPRLLISKPFYIFFYNVGKKTTVRVRIQGIESTSLRQCIYTYIDHVEQVSLM